MVNTATNTQPLYSSQSAQQNKDVVDGNSNEAKTKLSSDFETFLKMLTVQVQNQDPLNPVDSTEYATQLAQFSSVEQQVLTNDLIKGLSDKLGGTVLKEYGDWLGQEALVRAPANYVGNPVTLRPDYAKDATSAKLMVRNSAGDVVQSFDLEVGQKSVVWGGYKDDGTQLPLGVYKFEVESYKGETLLESKQAQIYTPIVEVRSNEKGEPVIQLADGTETSPTLVSGLRAQPSS
jgi:flagellar basal-body rod modification protein FlgD